MFEVELVQNFLTDLFCHTASSPSFENQVIRMAKATVLYSISKQQLKHDWQPVINHPQLPNETRLFEMA